MSRAKVGASVCLTVLVAALLTVAARPETDGEGGILEGLTQIQRSARLAMFLAKSALLSLSEDDVRVNVEEITRLLESEEATQTGLIARTERILAHVDAATLPFDMKAELSSSLDHALCFLRDALKAAQRIAASDGQADEAELRTLYAYLLAAHGYAELPTSLSGVEYSLSILPGSEIVVHAGESLQDAVDRVLPGGTVYVESGTYALRDTLRVSKSLTLAATAGAAGRIEIIGPDLPRQAAITISPGTQGQLLQVRVAEVAIVGGFNGIEIGPHVRAGDYVEGYLDVVLEHVTIMDSDHAGLSVVGLNSSVRLIHCQFVENGEFGVVVSQSALVDLANCQIVGNGGAVDAEPYRITAGVYAIEAAIVRLSRSVVEGNLGVGVRAEDTADLLLTDITVSDNTQGGVLVWDSVTLSLTASRILRNGGWGMQFLSASCEPHSLFVSHFFNGEVSGSGNMIPAAGDTDGNLSGSVCPTSYEWLNAL